MYACTSYVSSVGIMVVHVYVYVTLVVLVYVLWLYVYHCMCSYMCECVNYYVYTCLYAEEQYVHVC